MAKTNAKAPAIIGKAKAPEKNAVRELNDLRASKNYAAGDGLAGPTRGVKVDLVSSRFFPEKEIEEKIKLLFPDVDPGEEAVDCYVLVQELMVPEKQTTGGIILPDAVVEANQQVTSFCKIRSIGPLCFHWDMTGEPFPGGASFAIGDIVRMPKFGAQELVVDGVIFNYWKDRDMKGKITNLRKIVAMYFS